VLEADPGLGEWLPDARRSEAIAALSGTPLVLAMGEWDVTPILQAGPAHVGLLVVDGFLAREVEVQGHVSTELLGAGDVLRPWDDWEGGDVAALFRIRWNVLAPTRLLLLDRRFAARLRDFPEVTAALFERVHARSQRLAATKAIAQLVNVERRLIALFWHLAEQWGHVTPEGVAIPLTASHRLLGEIVGARRPTVSTAIKALASRGELVRRPDGTWLLPTHDAPEFTSRALRVVPARRRLFRVDP
jgi:CRP/FNR family cyclic AMP-dependent transcriptional regulator